MNEINGVPCYLAPQDVKFLFSIAVQAPVNAAILEVGSWMGGSSIAFANGLMAKKNLGSVIYAIDTWGGSPEHKELDCIKDDTMYEMFLKNIHDNLADLFVRPIRSSSVGASSRFKDNSLDIVFIDGDHSYEACLEDLTVWYPKVKQGGLIIGHDYWSEIKNDVYRAAQDFAHNFGLMLEEPSGLRFFAFHKS
jgi:predicted O-methyltransferase YrrM